MALDHEAIYSAYAGTVVTIDDSAGAFDKDGNSVSIDAVRAAAYASVGDQLDMQYWDAVNGTTTWKDHVAKVKADNPKP